MTVPFDLVGRVNEAFRREVLGVWPSLPSAPEPGSPPPQVGEVRSYHNPGVDITRMLVRSQTEDRLRREAGLPPAGDTLAAVDAAVEGRCAGPGCSAILTERSPSAHFCGPVCQEVWQQRQAGRSSPGSAPVRGSEYVDASAMRWRPDLVTAFDDSGLELAEETTDESGRTRRRWYWSRERGRFLRLDDGHRFVGAWAPDDGPADDLWSRLERELGDQRRLDPSPSAGPRPDVPVFHIGERVYYERDRDALVGWLRANGLDSEFVRVGQEATISGDELTVESFVTGPDGRVLFDELLGEPRIRRVSVPLVQPPPEPRSELLRRMGEAFDRAVLSGALDPCVDGAALWLPNPPADPEAPAAAGVAGGIELTRAPGSEPAGLDWSAVQAAALTLEGHNPPTRFNAGPAVIAALRSQAPRSRTPGGPVGGLLGVPVVPDESLAPDSWRLEYADGQRFESHVCQWEVSFETGFYRCGLRWSDRTRCESRADDPAAVRRTERMIGRQP